jgi:hypothetical protein
VLALGNSGTNPSDAERVVFADDFSGSAAGWEAVGTGGGDYIDGSYRLQGDPSETDSAVTAWPTVAPGVLPSAPENIRIDVDARRVSGQGQLTGFGVLCRIDAKDTYGFLIYGDRVQIVKNTERPPYYEELADRPLGVDANATTRMQAVCAGNAEEQHLRFLLDDRVVAEAVDRTDPISKGSVGLAVGTSAGDNSIVVDFDNFVVREVSEPQPR